MRTISLYDISVSKRARDQVDSLLAQGALAEGEATALLEQTVSTHFGAHCVAVNSGTAALHAALAGLGIGNGDEVLVPSFSFVASVHAILMVGATPVFVDVGEDYNIDPRLVSMALSDKTRAIIGVNMFGLPADYEALRKVIMGKSIAVVEDAAQSIGAVYKGVQSGLLGDVGCFSFYATKNVSGGEGGMVVTQDPDLSRFVTSFKNHGRSTTEGYAHYQLGYNYRMSNIHAALVLDSFGKMNRRTNKRRMAARMYDELLEGVKLVQTPHHYQERESVYHQYTIRVLGGLRNSLRDYLAAHQIQTGVYYPQPLYTYPHLTHYARVNTGRDLADQLCQEVLSLPVHHGLSKEDIHRVAEAIISWDGNQ